MEYKYVLKEAFTCQYGTIPAGSEIAIFRGQIFVNNGPIPSSYNDIFLDLIKDETKVVKMRVIKNKI